MGALERDRAYDADCCVRPLPGQSSIFEQAAGTFLCDVVIHPGLTGGMDAGCGDPFQGSGFGVGVTRDVGHDSSAVGAVLEDARDAVQV
jgi:hypothetical protein